MLNLDSSRRFEHFGAAGNDGAAHELTKPSDSSI